MHARRSPVSHRWVFPFYFYALDLDELSELIAASGDSALTTGGRSVSGSGIICAAAVLFANS